MGKFEVSSGLDFILSHVQPVLFPRTIMTKQLGRQLTILDRKSIIKYFQASDWEDCRVNAYGSYTNFHGINRAVPTFFMIDLDLSSFSSRNKLDVALDKTLRKINSVMGGLPSVLWTGNGFHIYQPVEGFILDQYDVFAEFIDPMKKDLTTRFIRFCEEFFSMRKSDPNHRPSVNSCLLRVPGSINSKCNAQVEIVQKWNGYKPAINYLLRDFRTYLIDEKFKENHNKNDHRPNKRSIDIGQSVYISWIERLLMNPINDYRKNAVALILAPYLLNIKKVPEDRAFATMEEWLQKCNSLKGLDFDIRCKVREALLQATKRRIPPMKLDTLKVRNNWLYMILSR